jgi:hypothetical protein
MQEPVKTTDQRVHLVFEKGRDPFPSEVILNRGRDFFEVSQPEEIQQSRPAFVLDDIRCNF